jgi:hypothetical protein
MTEKETQRELARLEADLENAIAQLVKAPASPEGWPVTLQAALKTLQKSKTQFPAAADRGKFRLVMQRIEQRVKQVQLLVESAALFYWGCAAVTRTQGAGYTHAGALEEFAEGGRMQLEA